MVCVKIIAMLLNPVSWYRLGGSLKGHNAFTLLELLIVVAIIALLAAILFPAFARVQENARRATCQSNLKQLGLGVMQYSQDYDERYPPCWIGMWSEVGSPGSNTIDDNGKKTETLVDMLDPYIKSAQIWKCPSVHGSPRVQSRPSDYGYNFGLLGCDISNPDYTTGPTYTIIEGAINEPSRTIMMADIMWAASDTGGLHWVSWNNGGSDQNPETWQTSFGSEYQGPYLNRNMIALGFPQKVSGPTRSWVMIGGDWSPAGYLAYWRHFSRANVLYCDGHVKPKGVVETYSHACGDPLSEWCNGN